MAVILLAFGTRGDVEPLWRVALAVAATCPSYAIHFVTHEAHVEREWMGNGGGVVAHGIVGDPVPIHDGGDGGDEHARRHQAHVAEVCAIACPRPALVAFNLFALEGYWLARHVGCPCVALSPYPMPHTPPSVEDVADGMVRQGYDPGIVAAAVASPDAPWDGCPTCMTMAAAVHWMHVPLLQRRRWAAFLDALTAGMEGCDDRADGAGFQPWPTAVPLLYGFPPILARDTLHPTLAEHGAGVFTCTGFWLNRPHTRDEGGDGCGVDGPLVLITFGTMAALGFFDHDDGARGVVEGDAGVTERRDGGGGAGAEEVAVPSPGSLPHPALIRLFTAIQSTLRRCGRVGLVVGSTPGDAVCTAALAVGACVVPPTPHDASGGGSRAAARSLHALPGHTPLWLCAEPLPLDAVLPGAAGIIHHGGSGTFAAAAAAGVAQVIIPFMFDQDTWAGVAIAWGVTPPNGAASWDQVDSTEAGVSQAAIDRVAQAVRWLCTPSPCKAAAVATLATVAREADGTARAAELLACHLPTPLHGGVGCTAATKPASSDGGAGGDDGRAVDMDARTLSVQEVTALLGERGMDGMVEVYEATLPDGTTLLTTSLHETAFLWRELFVEDAYGLRAWWREVLQSSSPPTPTTATPPRLVVLDVGTHVGMFGAALLHHYRAAVAGIARNKQVWQGALTWVGVEPAPLTHTLLCHNAAAWVAAAAAWVPPVSLTFHPVRTAVVAVDAVAAGVGDVGGAHDSITSLPMVVFPACLGNSSLKVGHKLAEVAGWGHGLAACATRQRSMVMVPACPMSHLLRHLHEAGVVADTTPVHLLKVDVEGAEADVLTTMTERDWDRMVGDVVVEVHAHVPGRLPTVMEALLSRGRYAACNVRVSPASCHDPRGSDDGMGAVDGWSDCTTVVVKAHRHATEVAHRPGVAPSSMSVGHDFK